MTRPMLIVLGGLPGVGKTTIARELAPRLGAVLLRIDSIELAIRESGVTAISLDDAGYRVGYAIAEDNLRLRQIVIADSVNPLPITRDAWLQAADRVEAPAVEIEIVCSDRQEHRRRVEQRLQELPTSTGPTWEEVLSRDYQPWGREHIVIDTAGRTVDRCVAMVWAALLTAR